MSNDFLPKTYDENEDLNSSGSSYMKFEVGENKFRILSSPIVGWEWWTEDKDGNRKPKRVRIDEQIDISTVEDQDGIKRFWAMPVWNYKTEKVEILEITQKGLQNTLKSLSRDKEWGSPMGYNILVVRKGEKLNTTYDLIPSPPSKLDEKIDKAFKEKYINLEALYEGEDPFTKEPSKKEIDDIDKVLGL